MGLEAVAIAHLQHLPALKPKVCTMKGHGVSSFYCNPVGGFNPSEKI